MRLSLKYRIAVVIVVLAVAMMALALGATLQSYAESNREQLAVSERVLVSMFADLSRIALVNSEFDELQPYVEQVVADPHVERILLIDRFNRVVVSSHVEEVGQPAPQFVDTAQKFWRTHVIENEAGRLGLLAINFSNDDLQRAIRDATDRGTTIALFGIIFIAVVSVLIGHLLTRRLRILTTAAQRFSDGDHSVKTNLTGTDEVSILGQAFDAMAGNIERDFVRLQTTETELLQAHHDLEKRVAERTSQLAVARDQALEASRTKSAFLANMSHELRTPLNAIIGYSEMLMDDADVGGYKIIQPDLQKIRTAGTHLLSLINDVLDLSKIEAGKIELIVGEFDVEQAIAEAVAAVKPLLEKSHNDLRVSCDTHVGSMNSDRTKLQQTLINLLSNATKFTERGTITVNAARARVNDEDWIEISVHDTGIGIAADQVSRLFSEFYQVDHSATRRYGGTGLGLAISRRFCQLMGGNITVESTVNQGSTFRIMLPATLRTTSRGTVEIPVVRTTQVARSLPDPREVRLNANPQLGGVAHERRSRIPKMLVIDDDENAREHITHFLTRQGFEVIVAATGEEGIAKARSLRPDVISLDVVMPGINGWEVLQELKKDPATAHIPVIMLTMTDEKLLGYSLGAAHFLSKPLDRGMFMEVLGRLLRSE